jgi:hypothetical protein
LPAKNFPSGQFSYGFVDTVVWPGVFANRSLDFGTSPPIVSAFVVRDYDKDPG